MTNCHHQKEIQNNDDDGDDNSKGSADCAGIPIMPITNGCLSKNRGWRIRCHGVLYCTVLRILIRVPASKMRPTLSRRWGKWHTHIFSLSLKPLINVERFKRRISADVQFVLLKYILKIVGSVRQRGSKSITRSSDRTSKLYFPCTQRSIHKRKPVSLSLWSMGRDARARATGCQHLLAPRTFRPALLTSRGLPDITRSS